MNYAGRLAKLEQQNPPPRQPMRIWMEVVEPLDDPDGGDEGVGGSVFGGRVVGAFASEAGSGYPGEYFTRNDDESLTQFKTRGFAAMRWNQDE